MSSLRQIAARAEAEALIARKFAEAGRPLSAEPPLSELSTIDDLDRQASCYDQIEPYPHDVRLAFWIGAIITAVAAALIIALAH